eukprot:Opistho-1_new@12423
MRAAVIFVAALVACVAPSCAFYLPGVEPNSFAEGATIELKVNKLTSVKTQLPFDYYSLPFCAPAKIENTLENLGEVLRGDRIKTSPFKIAMKRDSACSVLCKADYKSTQLHLFRRRIKEEYRINWLLDNLPAAMSITLKDNTQRFVQGFPIGHVDAHDDVEDVYLFNHANIRIKYNEDASAFEGYRVVGFEVRPESIATDQVKLVGDGECELPDGDRNPFLLPNKDNENGMPVVWTYSVTFIKSDTKWSERWDVYLAMNDNQIHWFSIINSLVIVLFLSGIVALILVRTVRRDIARYNDEEFQDDASDETGWKLVHGDVFRPPNYSTPLTACVGTGIQLLGMLIVTLMFALLGMLSPASRGSLLTMSLVLFVFMGVFAGYFSARLYKTCKGQNWKRQAMMTAMLFPSAVFSIAFFLNFFVWGKNSTFAVPFTTMIVLLLMWFGISLPLVFLGAYFGYRKAPYEQPVRTNQIPRQVPDQPWYMSSVTSMLLAGVLPFGAVFIELFFIFSALWENKFYYLFGFLFLVFVILVITCSENTIVLIYFYLCNEDYHWWWRSFLMSGGCALYVYFYAIFYYCTKLSITDPIATMVYFGYTFLIALTFWFLTGAIGFYSSFLFLRKIYGSVKID